MEVYFEDFIDVNGDVFVIDWQINFQDEGNDNWLF